MGTGGIGPIDYSIFYYCSRCQMKILHEDATKSKGGRALCFECGNLLRVNARNKPYRQKQIDKLTKTYVVLES